MGLHKLVPDHTAGISKDLKYDIIAESIEDADEIFLVAKDRLLNVNKWKTLCNDFGELHLTDSHGRQIQRKAHYNDYIRIQEAGQPTEWVHIDGIEYNDYPDEDYETIGIRMRDAKEPAEYHNEENDTSYNATGTFVAERRGRHVSVHYYSRNENIHAATWLAGHDMQWQALVEALLRVETIG
jgi:hypothetical protein